MITPTIHENHFLALENIDSKHVKNRISRELQKLEENCSLISIDNEFNESRNFDKNKYTVNILDNSNGLIYSIIVTNSYPFKTPSVKINFRPYQEFLKIGSTEHLKKIHKLNCLCCSTITCGNNWSPAFTMNHLIEEIRRLKGYKRDLIYKLLSDKIKLRYLIDDIDLDCWLF
jgi:ubiquitin-protein ligase